MANTFAPASGVTENEAKEFLSIAFLRALAAQAGLNVRRTGEYDNGLDLDIGSIKRPFADLPCASNVWLSFQLKATSHWHLVGDSLSFSITRATYDLLRGPCMTPTLLLLYCLPQDRASWMTFCCRKGQLGPMAHYTELTHAGYFLDLHGRPAVTTETITVHVPLANRLTAGVLVELYKSTIARLAGESPQ